LHILFFSKKAGLESITYNLKNMNDIWKMGLEHIYVVQKIQSPFMDIFFKIFSSFGEEPFYLIVCPAILWCFDYMFAVRLTMVFMFSVYFNTILKDLLKLPRPADITVNISRIKVKGYGFPSGHSQTSLVVWWLLADKFKKNWFWLITIIILLMIGFSRIYLGVHFIYDIFGGWIVGAVLLVLYFGFSDSIEKWLKSLKINIQLILAVIFPLGFALIHPVKEVVGAMAAMSGAAIGLIFTFNHLNYSADGNYMQKLLRFIVGLIITGIIYGGLKHIFPHEESNLYMLFCYIRYAILGFWFS